MIQFHRVGQHGDDDVVLIHLVIFRHLDGGQHIGDAGEAEQVELLHQFFGDTALDEIGASRFLVEEPRDVDHSIIVNRHNQVCILCIVDPWDVLVADAFDAVRAESVFEQGRALQGFACGNLAIGENLFHVIAAGNRPCRTGGGGHAAITVVRSHDLFQDLFHRVAGHFKVPQVIAELLELVEDHQVLSRFSQFPALVKNLFHIRFGAGSLDGLARDFGQPLEAFAGHALGQDSDGIASQQSRIVRAAAAVIARGRPHRFLRRRIELTCDQPRHQAGKRGADFVRAGWEPLANDGDDARRGPGQGGG